MESDLRTRKLKAERGKNIHNPRIGGGDLSRYAPYSARLDGPKCLSIQRKTGEPQTIAGIHGAEAQVRMVTLDYHMHKPDHLAWLTQHEHNIGWVAGREGAVDPLSIPAVRQIWRESGIGMVPSKLEGFAGQLPNRFVVVRHGPAD